MELTVHPKIFTSYIISFFLGGLLRIAFSLYRSDLFAFKGQPVLIIPPQPPARFRNLHIDLRGADAFQKTLYFGLIGLGRALDDHDELVICSAQMEMMFFYKRRQLA